MLAELKPIEDSIEYKPKSIMGQGNGPTIFYRNLKRHPLGESLVGKKNWQTISNILLSTVLPPIPGSVLLSVAQKKPSVEPNHLPATMESPRVLIEAPNQSLFEATWIYNEKRIL